MNKKSLKQYAAEDAKVDGADSLFQAFNARLTELAGIVAENDAASAVRKFRLWADETRQKFVQMSGNIPEQRRHFVSTLETRTTANLARAETAYAGKITQLEKDKQRWGQRFGSSLSANLDEPPQKNPYWLGGHVLFLVAVESIANSRFFAEASEFGLLGGTLTAITVSLGNVFIPLGLAFFGHRWFYKYDSYRTLGIVMIGLFLLWAFGFNHLVAQYRESLLVAADANSSTLNYVLLFALGAAVAGISFWKMWSFLDPFKQARKCLNDLQLTQKKFEKEIFTDLAVAQEKYNDINTQIQQLGTEIPARFTRDEADFSRAHSATIDETNRIFSTYYGEYCVMKVDPDPNRPVITPENATEYRVGIPEAERAFFAEMKTLLSGQMDTAIQEWAPKLHDILDKIVDLINRFQTVIIARLQEWAKQAQVA